MKIDSELETIFSQVRFIAFDFDGVFTDNMVYVTETGQESVVCCRSDGLGLNKLKQLGLSMCVISTEKNPVVSRRCEKIGIDCIQGCDDKLLTLKKLLDEYQCELKQTAFIGNDINDYDCLKAVGLPIVVADAHADVIDIASYVTNKKGGKGAVREVCDLISICKK